MSRVVPSGSSATPSATPRKEERQVLRILAVGAEGGGSGGLLHGIRQWGGPGGVASEAAPAPRRPARWRRPCPLPDQPAAHRRRSPRTARDDAPDAPGVRRTPPASAAAALIAHGENPQHLPLLLTRCGGRSRGRAARYHSAHALPDPPPA